MNGKWLSAFSKGFFRLARRFGTELIGGDTTRGPLAISITAIGEVPAKLALRRDAARAGDDIWLSGATGEAALALAHLTGRVRLSGRARDACLHRLHAPEPRVNLGRSLRGLARSAIDVSDGLLADLGHIAEASGVAAESPEDLPRAEAIASARTGRSRGVPARGRRRLRARFTAPRSKRSAIEATGKKAGVRVTVVGAIVAGKPGVRVRATGGGFISTPRTGFDHFA